MGGSGVIDPLNVKFFHCFSCFEVLASAGYSVTRSNVKVKVRLLTNINGFLLHILSLGKSVRGQLRRVVEGLIALVGSSPYLQI